MVNGVLGVSGLNVQLLVEVVSSKDLGCADNHRLEVMNVWEMVTRSGNAASNLVKVRYLVTGSLTQLNHQICGSSVFVLTGEQS